MTSDEAGRLKPAAKDERACSHGRLLDTERTAEGQETGRLVCRECGAVLSTDSGDNNVKKDMS